MAEETLRRQNNKWFSPRPHDLPPQDVEVLGRRRGHHDLNVVFRCKHEKPLQPSAGVFGTLAFESVRQQHDQSAQVLPFVFGAGDELIDNHLGRVGEIAKLSLPEDEAVRKHKAVAVIKSQHACLGERTVKDLDLGLIRRNVSKRIVSSGVHHVVKHRMPLAECPAL